MKKMFFLLLIACLTVGCIRETRSRTTITVESLWTLTLPSGQGIYMKIGDNVRFFINDYTVKNLNEHEVIVSVYDPAIEDVDLSTLWMLVLQPGERTAVPVAIFTDGPCQFCVTRIDGQELKGPEKSLEIVI